MAARKLTPRALLEALSKGRLQPLYILGAGGEPKRGTDRIAVADCLEALRRAVLGEEPDDWNLTVLSGERVEIAAVIDAAMTLPLSGRRLVIVRGAGELAGSRDEGVLKGQAEALRKMASMREFTSVTVLVEPPLDGRLRLHKALLESACVVPCSSPDPREMPGWIRDRAAEAGLKIQPRAAETLAGIVGDDTLRARTELEKLALAVGSGPEARAVTPQDVAAIAAGGAVADAWRMCDAVARLDEASALRIARELLDAGEEQIALIGALAFRLRQMIQAAEAHRSGLREGDIFQRVRIWGEAHEAISTTLPRYDPAALLEGLAELYRADRKAKSGGRPGEALLSAIGRIVRGQPSAPRA